MRNMAGPLLVLWLLGVCGCEQILRRPPVETRRIRAEALVMEAQADVQKSWALCMETRSNLKLKQSNKPVLEVCGAPPVPVVTVTTSHKQGEVPAFSVIPPMGDLPLVGGLIGALP